MAKDLNFILDSGPLKRLTATHAHTHTHARALSSYQVLFVSCVQVTNASDESQFVSQQDVLCVRSQRRHTSAGVSTLTSYTTTGSVKNCEILSGAPGRAIKSSRAAAGEVCTILLPNQTDNSLADKHNSSLVAVCVVGRLQSEVKPVCFL